MTAGTASPLGQIECELPNPKEEKMGNNEFLSRREFITRSGLVLAGTAVGAAGMCTVGFQQPQASAWPWPYKELDPDKAAQIAYDAYMSGSN
jgi:hypothetical protein